MEADEAGPAGDEDAGPAIRTLECLIGGGHPRSPTEAADTYLEWAPHLAHKDWAAGFTVAMELGRVTRAMTIEELLTVKSR